FMRVSHHIDERNSPYKATHAAAKLLSSNFRLLKSWPLAITAYNHGPGGMQKAVRTVGSNNIDTIIRNYEAPAFGFASRNFYAEFLAARNVYRNLYEKDAVTHPPQVEPVKIDKKISISQLRGDTPLDAETLKQLNPCLRPGAFDTYQYQPLPANYQIYVPATMAKQVNYSLNLIQAPKHRGSS